MVYNDSEFVADRKIIELNQIENTETDVFYEGWLQDRRHKIKNEDLEINKGKTTIPSTLIFNFSMLILSISGAQRQHDPSRSHRALSY